MVCTFSIITPVGGGGSTYILVGGTGDVPLDRLPFFELPTLGTQFSMYFRLSSNVMTLQVMF